jgi:hypothetical protein
VRTQFKVPIGKFEGVEEALTRIGGNLYMMDATRKLTVAAIDAARSRGAVGHLQVPHHRARAQTINDGMDVIGGKGIMMGPSNFLGGAYMQHPVAITVEGANILTRSLIIFGQGAIRCHPYLLKEMDATPARDSRAASIAFDARCGATFASRWQPRARVRDGHHGLALRDVERRRGARDEALLPAAHALLRALAFLADVSMGTLGGELKRKEKLSARLGDILSLMYLCSATLRRYELEGRQAADAPLMHWAIWDAMFKAQNAFEGVISNFPNPIARRSRASSCSARPSVRGSVGPLGHEVRALLIAPSATRDRLTDNVFIGRDDDDPVALIERALDATMAPSRSRRRSARRSRKASSTAACARRRGRHARAARRCVRDRSPPTRRACSRSISARRARSSPSTTSTATSAHRCSSAARIAGSAAEPRRRERLSERMHEREPIYIVDGARTPFLKARNKPGPFAASDSATAAGSALLLRQRFEAPQLDEVILGCAAPSADEVNIGRVAALRMGCGQKCRAGR